MNQINYEAFTIVSFLPRKQGTNVNTPSFQPHTVKRDHDGEIFSIGDFVTNGTKMKGVITGFEMLEDYVYVNHTWSGVGMNLGSLKKIIELPSEHQVDDEVIFSIKIQREGTINEVNHFFYDAVSKVIAVHFYKNKVKYDLEIPLGDEPPTRIYNINSRFVKPKK